MSGNSSLEGGHQVAMKFTQTGWPLRLARSMVPPPICGTDSAGAGSPIWKSAAEPAGDGPTDGAPEDALGLGPIDGEVDAPIAGVTDGEGDGPIDGETGAAGV